jgi:RNA ligase (TIGR02306 family)
MESKAPCQNLVELIEGLDVTELLGVQKWEAPISAQLAGQAKGTFPTSLIPKTDQERIQNCFRDIQKKGDVTYEVTMKLDGSSMTIFRWEGELRVCSRNMELLINEENKDNSFVAMALKIGDKIPNGFAFQGELMGPGIQGNCEGFTEHKFFVFDIFDIAKHEYLSAYDRRLRCTYAELEYVPIISAAALAPASVEAGLAIADGPSINHKIREGLVWKCNEDPSFSFKTISNKYLLSGGD